MRRLINTVKKYIKKLFPKQKMGRDVIIGVISQEKARYIKKGARVITDKGYGNIIDLRDNNWLVIGDKSQKNQEPKNRHKKAHLVKQYLVTFMTPGAGKVKIPLAYADYKYIHQLEVDSEIEFTITRNKTAKLTNREIERREHIPFFNTRASGKHILDKLHKNNFKIVKL